MRRFLFVGLLGLIPNLSAQDWQNRDVAHLQIGLGKKLFVPVWSITNLRTQTLNNTNLFAGLGIRGKTWWLEGMLQRQWNNKANQIMADFRFRKQLDERWSVYAEGAPFLTKRAFYEFIIVEAQAWKKFKFGAETENVHQSGPDAVVVGPRISRVLARIGNADVSAAVAVRVSLVGGHTEPRLYLQFNRHIH